MSCQYIFVKYYLIPLNPFIFLVRHLDEKFHDTRHDSIAEIARSQSDDFVSSTSESSTHVELFCDLDG